MRALHFDPFAGASGDMILGALVDVTKGKDAGELERRLRDALPFDLTLGHERVVRRGLAGSRIDVTVREDRPPRRGLSDILGIISSADLPPAVSEGAAGTFRRLAEAEATVHGTGVDEVHFHEIGAGDCLVDVVGAHLLIHDMDVGRITSGSVPLGSGTVETAHGQLPVPAPATAELLRGVPLSGAEVEGEAVTPTGAALLVTLAGGYTSAPRMTLAGTGYGFGSREGGSLPNALRVFLGEAAEAPPGGIDWNEEVAVLETTIDDMPGEWAGDLFEVLAGAGALEVSTTPVGMKKSRPGVRLTVLTRPGDALRIAAIIQRETTTFGVRMRTERRTALARELRPVETPWGEVHVKLGRLAGEVVQVSPEHDDCRRVAREAGVPLKKVYEAALAAFRSSES